MKHVIIEDAGFSPRLAQILATWIPAGRTRRLLTTGELYRYCKENNQDIARLLNCREITPEMVNEVREKFASLADN